MISITQLIFLLLIVLLVFGDIKNIINKIKKFFSDKKENKK
jgi:Sec-independent protein translocase protein TatA